jgi:hypothetical protein
LISIAEGSSHFGGLLLIGLLVGKRYGPRSLLLVSIHHFGPPLLCLGLGTMVFFGAGSGEEEGWCSVVFCFCFFKDASGPFLFFDYGLPVGRFVLLFLRIPAA